MDSALDLIYTEYLARTEIHQQALATELFQRFPQWRDAVERQLQVQHFLEEQLKGPLTPGKLPADVVGGAPEADMQVMQRWRPHYEILQEIGRGTMGVVYLAWHRTLHRLVSLKMTMTGVPISPQESARFLEEAQAVARLQHPNIVEIYEIGLQENRPYLVLEYVGGGNLAQKIARQPLPIRQSTILMEKLARALHYIHRRGIIHRDLAPTNILYTEEGEPKISDFGLAKIVIGGRLSDAGAEMMYGTPSYMAPEQVEGQADQVGPASDVYALGAILYEMLVGRPLFRGENLQATLQLVRSQQPEPPSVLQPNVPPELDAICLKCLQKDPAQRYASAQALAEELHRIVERT